MFQKATKTKSKLRLAIIAPSGAGKTMSALRIAKGLGGKIALIDSEHLSASKYADRFDFDTAEINAPYKIADYVKAIDEAGKSGYNVIIIDSLSHAWKWILDYVEDIARAKHKGNSFTAWKDANPIQDALVNAIIESPCHIIGTMRAKMAYEIAKGSDGKMKPEKIGLAPEQRQGLEYEFDMVMDGNTEHIFTVSKDRTGKFQDRYFTPDEKIGEEIASWLSSGSDAVAKVKTADPENTLQAEKLKQQITVIYGEIKELLGDKIPQKLQVYMANFDLHTVKELESGLQGMRILLEKQKVKPDAKA